MKDRTLLFTVNTNGYAELYASCIESQEKYANKYGYDYVNVVKPKYVLKNSFELSSWSKVPLILSALNSNYKVVMFLDGDCFLSDDCPPLEKLFDEFPEDKSIFGANGFSGRPNAGVMIYKNTEKSKSFVKELLRLNYYNYPIPESDIVGAENTYFVYLMREHDGTQVISRSWNKNSDDNLPIYIKHYSGPYKKKVNELSSYSKKNWKRVMRIRKFGKIIGYSNNRFNHNHGPRLMSMIKKLHKMHLANYPGIFDKKTFNTIWQTVENEKKTAFELSKYPKLG
ncbi:MAG: glycosyltransferase family 77 protein [bacterium]|nr:glycosyltransferase family 77 protein [bacterium]